MFGFHDMPSSQVAAVARLGNSHFVDRRRRHRISQTARLPVGNSHCHANFSDRQGLVVRPVRLYLQYPGVDAAVHVNRVQARALGHCESLGVRELERRARVSMPVITSIEKRNKVVSVLPLADLERTCSTIGITLSDLLDPEPNSKAQEASKPLPDLG